MMVVTSKVDSDDRKWRTSVGNCAFCSLSQPPESQSRLLKLFCHFRSRTRVRLNRAHGAIFNNVRLSSEIKRVVRMKFKRPPFGRKIALFSAFDRIFPLSAATPSNQRRPSPLLFLSSPTSPRLNKVFILRAETTEGCSFVFRLSFLLLPSRLALSLGRGRHTAAHSFPPSLTVPSHTASPKVSLSLSLIIGL